MYTSTILVFYFGFFLVKTDLGGQWIIYQVVGNNRTLIYSFVRLRVDQICLTIFVYLYIHKICLVFNIALHC
jgi:hypothetical protein